MDKIHFWDFPPEIRIKLEPNFRKRFFSDAIKYFGKSENAGLFVRKKSSIYGKTKFSGSTIRMLKSAKDGGLYDHCYGWMALELARKIGYEINNVEKNIVSYKARNSLPTTTKLPILVTPEFTSILAHMMGDGTDKRTRLGTASYAQYNIFGLNNFNKKLTNVFGKTNKKLISEKYKTVFVPRGMILIIKKYFSVRGFGSYESRVPEKLFSMPKEHRLAFLTAFLVDEGTIYDIVSFRLANKKVVEQVREIAISLGYKCSDLLVSRNKNGPFVYGFNISNFSLDKFSNDIKLLSEKCPTCNLAQKQKYFDHLVSLGRHSGHKREKTKTKELILSLIEKEPKTVIELSELTGVCRRTVRNHLEDFERSNKVRILGKKPMGAKLWLMR